MADFWLLKNATPGPTKPSLTTVRTQSPILIDKSEILGNPDRAEDEYTPFIFKETLHAPVLFQTLFYEIHEQTSPYC